MCDDAARLRTGLPPLRVEVRRAQRRIARRRARRRPLLRGVFRQARVNKGRNRDTAWFAAIDAEWPALDRAFQEWLDPANFDARRPPAHAPVGADPADPRQRSIRKQRSAKAFALRRDRPIPGARLQPSAGGSDQARRLQPSAS